MTEASLTPSGARSWVIGGALDFTTVPELWRSIQALIDDTAEATLSLADVTRTNSAGLVLLVEARGLARQRGCRLRFADLPAELRDLASLSGCEALLAEDAT